MTATVDLSWDDLVDLITRGITEQVAEIQMRESGGVSVLTDEDMGIIRQQALTQMTQVWLDILAEQNRTIALNMVADGLISREGHVWNWLEARADRYVLARQAVLNTEE